MRYGSPRSCFGNFFPSFFTYSLSFVPTLMMPVRLRLSSRTKDVTSPSFFRSSSVLALTSISAEISISEFFHPSIRIEPTGAPLTARVPPEPKSRSEEHTSELQSRQYLVCRLLLEKKKEPTSILQIETSELGDCYYGMLLSADA